MLRKGWEGDPFGKKPKRTPFFGKAKVPVHERNTFCLAYKQKKRRSRGQKETRYQNSPAGSDMMKTGGASNDPSSFLKMGKTQTESF